MSVGVTPVLVGARFCIAKVRRPRPNAYIPRVIIENKVSARTQRMRPLPYVSAINPERPNRIPDGRGR